MSSGDKTFVDLSDGVAPGTQLNGIYEIDERIAMGGMGEVYRGPHYTTVGWLRVAVCDLGKDSFV